MGRLQLKLQRQQSAIEEIQALKVCLYGTCMLRSHTSSVCSACGLLLQAIPGCDTIFYKHPLQICIHIYTLWSHLYYTYQEGGSFTSAMCTHKASVDCVSVCR